MSQNTQYLTRPRRSSRSSSSSGSSSSRSSSSSRKEQKAESGLEKPYTPVFQPTGYAYKIALPTRPQPGQTPWPTQLPPVVGPALGEATNRPRHNSMSATTAAHHQHQQQQHGRSSSGSSVSSSSSAVSVSSAPPLSMSRSSSVSASSRSRSSVGAPPAAPAAPTVQPWSYGLNPLLAPGGGLLWSLHRPTSYIKIRASSLSTPGPLTYNHRAMPVLVTRTPLVLLVVLPGNQHLRVQGDSLGALVDAVHDALAVQAAAPQWAAADQHSAARAYRARCGNDQTELAKGVKRVDLLGENAAFAGITPTVTASGAQEWVLRIVSSA